MFTLACLVVTMPLLAHADMPVPAPLPLPPSPAKNPKVLASRAGVVDLVNGLLFYGDIDPGAAEPVRPDGSRARNAVVALRLADGQPAWRVPGVGEPFYAVDNLVVAWADDDRDEVLAVIDSTQGKLLRQIRLGERPAAARPPADPCAPQPSLVTVYGGRGRKLERVTSFLSCPDPGWGGARRTDEEIAAARARCSSWTKKVRWDLDTGAEETVSLPHRAAASQVSSLPRLDLPGLTVGSVILVPGSTALVGQRTDGTTLWSVPYPPAKATSAAPRCGAKPTSGGF